MAHSQHYPQQVFSPPMSTPSPANAPSPNYFPPAKRQRISPNPQSPYDSPSFSTLQLPQPGPQVNGVLTNGAHPPMAHQGLMGPPLTRPEKASEKATDMTEIADVLTSSGIDLKEEEAHLLNPLLPTTYQNNLTTSFNSQGSSLGTLSAGNSFSEYFPSRVPGSQATFYGAGPFNQPLQPHKTAEQVLKEQREKANRRQAERYQHHLNEPFLLQGTVNHKLQHAGYTSQIQIANTGVVYPVANQPSSAAVQGPDGSSIIATKGSALLLQKQDSSLLADMLALMSLACEDLIRGVLEQGVALAKQRRLHSHGVVPAEWTDLAVDEGANPNTALTARSGLESAVSPMTMPPLKRSFSASQPPSASETRPTLTMHNHVVAALRKQVQQEKAIEQLRLQKRARRAAEAAASGEGGRTPPVSTPAGPGTPGLLAPDSDKKTSKKEQRKLAEAKVTEAQQHAHANETARMALGGSSKKYSWMNKGSGTSTPTGFGPNRINTAVNNGTPGTPSGSGTGSAGGPGGQNDGGKRFGEWREDKGKGDGVQVRDVLHVLELDRKAKKTIQRAYIKMRPSGSEG